MSKIRQILVTGATGFLGQHLIRFLRKQPDLVVYGISRNGGCVDDITIDPVDIGVAADLVSWCERRPRLDAILHLAAVVPGSFDSVESANSLLTNIAMSKNVVDVAVHGGSDLIYASSMSVYGQVASVPVHEDTALHPENPYSVSKYVGEMLCEIAHRRHGIRTVTLRISAPYGLGQKMPTVLWTFMRAAIQSRDLLLFGTGERVQDFTYVDDVVQALRQALNSSVSGVYNIASGSPVTMQQLAETVLAVVPASRSRIALSGQVDPQEGYRGVYCIDKAAQQLAYSPRFSLADGLQAMLAPAMTCGVQTC